MKRITHRRLLKSIDSALSCYSKAEETLHKCCMRLMEETQEMFRKFCLSKVKTIKRYIKNDPRFLEFPEASKKEILQAFPFDLIIQLGERTTSLYYFMFNPRLIKKIAKHYNARLELRVEGGVFRPYEPAFPPELWSDLQKHAKSHFSGVREAKKAAKLIKKLDQRFEKLAKVFEKNFKGFY